MKKIIVLLYLLPFSANLFAQDDTPKFKRTGIYGEFGIGEYAHADLNLEHYLINKKNWHIGARAGYGTWGSWSGVGGREGIFVASGLLGKKYHFLEMQAGGLLLSYKYTALVTPTTSKEMTSNNVYLSVSIGYALRYKHFLFRANVNTDFSSLATVNAGLGFLFK